MALKPVPMSDKRFDEISGLVRKSYKNSCILFMDEIVNPDLYSSYEDYKLCLGEVTEEKLLFHGTHARLINTIASEGFDPVKNVTSAYGKGSYFALDASYSQSYMKSTDREDISYMFLVQMAIGKTGINTNNDDCDTFVDKLENPKIFVARNRFAAYPKYVIAFYKNAK